MYSLESLISELCVCDLNLQECWRWHVYAGSRFVGGAGMMMELEGGDGNRILTPRIRQASCCCKWSGKRVMEIIRVSVKMFPSLITDRAYFQFSNLCTPHGSELNFNNISRTKPAERTSQWRGTNAQLFFFISRYLQYCDTHLLWQDVISDVVALRDRECDPSVTRDVTRDVLVTQWMARDTWRGDTCDIANPLDCAG